jgi:hypothetical protein
VRESHPLPFSLAFDGKYLGTAYLYHGMMHPSMQRPPARDGHEKRELVQRKPLIPYRKQPLELLFSPLLIARINHSWYAAHGCSIQGLNREADEISARSRRCNRRRKPALATASVGWEGQAIRMTRKSEDLPMMKPVRPLVEKGWPPKIFHHDYG